LGDGHLARGQDVSGKPYYNGSESTMRCSHTVRSRGTAAGAVAIRAVRSKVFSWRGRRTRTSATPFVGRTNALLRDLIASYVDPYERSRPPNRLRRIKTNRVITTISGRNENKKIILTFYALAMKKSQIVESSKVKS
jgi:hypothetical protein